MINSTINENGAGMITGKALNLALTEIVNAMGTGSGAGGEKLYMVEMAAEIPTSVMPTEGVSYEIPSFCAEHNKEVYNKLQTVRNNGEELEGIIYVDWTHELRSYGNIDTNEYRINLPIRWGIDGYGNLMFTFSENSVKWNNYGSSSEYNTLYLWSDGYFRNYTENSGAE